MGVVRVEALAVLYLSFHESLQEFLLGVEGLIQGFVQKVIHCLILVGHIAVAGVKVSGTGFWSFKSFSASICGKLILGDKSCSGSFCIERLSKAVLLVSGCLVLICNWPVSCGEHEKFSKFIQGVLALNVCLGRLKLMVLAKTEIGV